VRAIDERAIKAHADLRFRSEYDYALFECYRSAKVIAFPERSGLAIAWRVRGAGGGGGMPLSLAEETREASVLSDAVKENPLVRGVFISNMEYVLRARGFSVTHAASRR